MLSLDANKKFNKEDMITVVPAKVSEAGYVVSKGGLITAAEKKALNNYLAGAVKLMSGKTKSDAKEIAKEYVEGTNNSGISLLNIQVKKDELKEAASEFGLREKVNYASDADVSNLTDVVSLGVGAVASSMLLPIAAADPEKLSITLAAAALAYTATKGVKFAASELTHSKTDEQKKKAAEYADVKHAMLALKLLKKEIEAPIKAAAKAKYKEEVAQLFAAGYGNPGGFVTTPMVKDAPGAETPKAETEGKKSSFWKEAMEMYATFGNPGGGMVHKDIPTKDEKVETGKAEPAKKEEKKSSYMDEVRETYARFGNPSGGMVNAATIKKQKGGR